MAITRLTAPSITGLTIPNTSINNASLNSVTALPSGVGGKVLQVVQAVDKNQGSFQLATDTLSTMMTVNITPSSTSSKVLVRFDVYLGTESNQNYPYVVLRRNGSDIYRANTAGSRKNSTGGTGFIDGNKLQCLSNEFLDSPSSTSQVAYTINVAGYNNLVFYKNIPNDNNTQQATACSQITAMEVLT
tara:strand:+ start:384 stop:947 length:564 start_codon:yes stop_codon:yes gene_type:complete